MTPTSVFDLGRMRHLDLLAEWFRLNPAVEGGPADYWMAALSKERLAGAILTAGTR
jgi:hypothetical protein